MIRNNKPLTVTIAHVNDTHSYFDPTSLALSVVHKGVPYQPFVSAGGFARIATRLEQIKAENREQGFLFLHAGDCFQGTLYFSLFKGEANAELLNALGPDAMVLGNHELDMGNEPVGKFARDIEFPLLAGNWNLSEEASKQYPIKHLDNVYHFDTETRTARWTEKTIDGETMAIFGLSMEKMADIANPDCDTYFEPVLATATKTVAAIRATGINKIILLSHMGYEADLKLAAEIAGIGLIVGGHSHVLQGDFSELGLISQDEYGVRVNDTYVVQAGFHAMTLGHCRVHFDEKGRVTQLEGRNELLVGRRVFMDVDHEASLVPYEAVRDQVQSHPNVVVCRKHAGIKRILAEKYQPRVRSLQQQKIACLETPLRHIRIPDALGGSELAPLVAHSFLYTMKSLGYPVDFALHNAGGVRNSLNAGPVTIADVAGKLLPFAVPIGVYAIEGRYIPEIIEGAIDNAIGNGVTGTGSGSYPYTSQLDFHYDKEQTKGMRVSAVTIGGYPLDPDKVYIGSSSAYTMKGKEGYDAILNMESDSEVTTWSMADCFVKLLSEHPDIVNHLKLNSLSSVPK
ncbi:bifunctional metallophosphatase/5'-nucleotidase [Vibrio parahaemolyticus]|uniref:bifunctional metallophosphatase/5'-nucleotidase n=1 Tax=Vibrio mediterranei TaxID=689 RepID=UPI0040692E89